MDRVRFFLQAALLVVALHSRCSATIIIADDFSQPNFDTGKHTPFNVYGTRIWDGAANGAGLVPNNGSTPSNTVLGTNLPGGSWQFGAGGNNDYDCNEVGNLNGYGASNTSLTGSVTAVPNLRIHNGENVGLSLAGYNSATRLTVSVAVCPQSNDCYVGFDSVLRTANNFTGLRVDQKGGVSLFVNGVQAGSSIAFTGTFSNTTASLLSFTVNTTTGAISAISLQGSTSIYNFTTTAFTPSATSYVAFYAPGGGTSIFAYLQVASTASAAVPPVTPPPPPPVLVAPPAPAGLVAHGSNGQVSLAWTASSGATSYNIYRGTTPGGEGSKPIFTSSSLSYSDTSVTNGTTYDYTVTASNSGGSSFSSNEASGTPVAAIPPPPAVTSPAPTSTTTVISDDFSQPNFDTGNHSPFNVYGSRIWDGAPGGTGLVPNSGTTPGKTILGVDLPGGVWQSGSGGNDYDANEIGNLPGYGASNIKLTGGVNAIPYASLHNGENVAISLSGYHEATQLTITVDVCPQTNDCYVGFDSALKVANNFTGLRVDQTGGVSLFVNSTQVGSAIPFTGTFSKATASLFTFTVNTTTGAISAISLQGSATSYSFTTTAFTTAATSYAALSAPSGGNSFFAYLQITAGSSADLGIGSGSPGTPPAPASAPSPFGISGDNNTTETLSTYAPQLSAAGVQWMRGIDTWSNIEPALGTYNFANVDSELAAASANNLQVSGLFFYGSNWVSSAANFPTGNLPAWQGYITALITHVNGKVKNWEVWNEPPGMGNGTPTDYANLVNSAYSAAHAADPTCNVGLCAASNNVNWLYQSIKAGAADHFDYIVVHPYEVLDAVDSGFEGEYMSIVPTIRKMLADRDPARANVPVWFTEVGQALGDVNGSVTVSTTSQAQDLVKAFTMGIAQGAAHVNWFEGKDGDSGPMGLLDGSGNPRPAYTALSRLTKYLGPNPVYLGWVQLNGKDYGFVFQGATTTVMATWAPPGVHDTVAFSPIVTIVDPVANTCTPNVASFPLTNAPVLVIGVPASIVTTAQADLAQPFSWGGNYSTASTVSVVMGEPNVESGLHQLYADSTSTYSPAPNGPARYCGPSSGQSFTVDPNFLSYTQKTITVTAVVRGDAANDGAGFNLKYEGVNGWESVPNWNAIPGNSQWYTKTWTITDPQFVGKWTYNFMFDSDDTSHSKYYIQSVTVSK